jgi:hypothetical protein
MVLRRTLVPMRAIFLLPGVPMSLTCFMRKGEYAMSVGTILIIILIIFLLGGFSGRFGGYGYGFGHGGIGVIGIIIIVLIVLVLMGRI